MKLHDVLGSRYGVSANPLKTERRVELLALVLVALLILQLLYSALRYATLSSPEVVVPSAESLAVTAAMAAAGADMAQSNDIRLRPVFWQSRRPQDGPDDTVLDEGLAAQPGELKDVQLVGLFGAGKSAGVIVIIKGKQSRVMVGGDIAGWTLDKVKRDRALLQGDGKTHELMLSRLSVSGKEQAEKPAAKPAKKPARKPVRRLGRAQVSQ